MKRGQCAACGAKTNPLDHPCLRCSSQPGEACQGRDGYIDTPHTARGGSATCRECADAGYQPLTLDVPA